MPEPMPPEPRPEPSAAVYLPGVPLGPVFPFPPMPEPEDNRTTPERVELGRKLFYDRRLSRTEEVACASCHLQEHAFSDPKPLSEGVRGRLGTRNAPSLTNVGYMTSFFWDGGVRSLELQAIDPIRNPLEMDMTLAEVNERLSDDPEMVAAFEAAYGEGPSEFTLPRALAAFERTLISDQSRWDAFQRGDETALSAEEQRGMLIFFGETGECAHCHTGYNLTTNAFRNNGTRPDDPDLGREKLTTRASDRGKFKVPTLRNIAVTAPYMHDGSLDTLEAVIEHYDRGGEGHPNTDPTIAPLALSDTEKSDLLAFLKALTDQRFLLAPEFAQPNVE